MPVAPSAKSFSNASWKSPALGAAVAGASDDVLSFCQNSSADSSTPDTKLSSPNRIVSGTTVMPCCCASAAGMSAAESVTIRTVTIAPYVVRTCGRVFTAAPLSVRATQEPEHHVSLLDACDLRKREIEDSTGPHAGRHDDDVGGVEQRA